MSNITLALNGEPIRMVNMTVSPSLKFKDKDKSGQTSSTDTAEQGTKAKEIKVEGMIPYTDSAQLTRLFELAEATSKGGERQRYRVANPTAKAVKLRQVMFAGDLEAKEQKNVMAWAVSFTLKEQNSVSEKKEQRQKMPASKQQVPGDGGGDDGKGKGEQHGWFYKTMSKVNDMLGPAATADSGGSGEADKKS
ncbi:hypothetical protein [Trabulsiella odontotermitis]|uniref:Uncharacterized protein n=1 Tax=Trabulsiella odontotermitis TaxID=379893 RepID=A0A0L0H0A7_9ENTR|nr:hypothetical protein [Trabulsiella odontotermitis]KNC94143.1 hypothetical protein GM31_16350 [Trabulsiella odontotermitis]